MNMLLSLEDHNDQQFIKYHQQKQNRKSRGRQMFKLKMLRSTAQGSVNFFDKGSDSKYFQCCGLYSLCGNYSCLSLQPQNGYVHVPLKFSLQKEAQTGSGPQAVVYQILIRQKKSIMTNYQLQDFNCFIKTKFLHIQLAGEQTKIRIIQGKENHRKIGKEILLFLRT